MQYKSPIKILTHFLQKGENLKDISFIHLKKRVLAEFELSNKLTIRTSKGDFSKNEIINIFDSINDKTLNHHLIILEHPDLLYFLENNKIKDELIFDGSIYNEPDFVNFLSPFVANSIGLFFLSILKNDQPPFEITDFENLPILRKDEHLIKNRVIAFLENRINEIEQVQLLFGKTKELPVITNYFNTEFIHALNCLPSKHFNIERSLFIECGIDFIKAFLINKVDNYDYLKDIKYIQKQLSNLNVNDYLLEELLELTKFIYSYVPASKRRSDSRKGIAAVVIGFFIVILAIANNDNKKSHQLYDYSNPPWQKELNKQLNKMYQDDIDSLFMDIPRIRREENKNAFDSIGERLKEAIRNADSIRKLLDAQLIDTLLSKNKHLINNDSSLEIANTRIKDSLLSRKNTLTKKDSIFDTIQKRMNKKDLEVIRAILDSTRNDIKNNLNFIDSFVAPKNKTVNP